MTSRWRKGCAWAVAVLVVGACGGEEADTTPGEAVQGNRQGSVAAAPDPDLDNCVSRGGYTGAQMVVEMQDNAFEPDCITDVGDEIATLELRNTGQALHNFSVAAAGVDVDVDPGTSTTVTVDVSGGAVGFICKYHPDAMFGALFPSE